MSNDPNLNKPASVFFFISLGIVLLIMGVQFLKGGFQEITFISKDWYWNFVFLIPVTFLGLFFIQKRYQKTKKITSIGKNYLLYTTLKMISSFVFLLPWLLNKDETSKPMVINFFIVFFPFLLVETWLLVRLLNSPLDEKVKNEENQDEIL